METTTTHRADDARHDGRSAPRGRLGVAACAAVGVLVLALSWFRLSSVDIGYHVAYGRHFLATGRIVDRDPFLYPETAEPFFVNANWGSQVVMAIAERIAGAGGLIALRVALITAAFAGIAAAVRRATGGWHWVAWAWLLAAIAAYERFSMRPELFSYAILAAMVAIHVRGLGRRRDVGLLAGLQLLWVNCHSYFLVGLLTTGCFFIEAAAHAAWRRLRGAKAARNTDRLQTGRTSTGWKPVPQPGWRRLGLALALQIAMCFVNPWHYRGAMFPLQTLEFLRSQQVTGGGPDAMSESPWSAITEFQSPFAHAGYTIFHRTITAYWALLAAAALAGLAALSRGRLATVLMLMALFAMSAEMRRNIAQFAIAGAPLIAVAWAETIRDFDVPRRVAGVVRAVLVIATIGASGWWTAGIVDGRFYYTERRINREFGAGYSDRWFPRDAVAWLAREDRVRPNLFVDYGASSNVLPWLPERFKLMVDTNTFAYAESTLDEADRIGLARAKEDYQRPFDAYGVNAVLLSAGPNTEPLIRLMAHDLDWALIYFDRRTVIFLRRMHDHVSVTMANKPTEASLDARAWIASARGPARYRALELSTAAGVPIALGWHRPAAELLEEVVLLTPDFDQAWFNLGVCHGNLAQAAARGGRLDEARSHWERAAHCFAETVRFNPNHHAAATYLKSTQSALDFLDAR